MSVVRPFKALRPKKEYVKEVASLPYDVMNREEAKEMSKGNPYSFLHVVRPEIDVDDSMSMYDEKVYETARENLIRFEKEGILEQDQKDCYYIYRQIMDGRVQTGLVATTSVDDYLNDIIKKHEYTRPEKEQDRINNFDYCDANTAPIFLTYRRNDRVAEITSEWTKNNKPIYDFVSDDEITHTVWVIDNSELITEIENIFANIDYLYIADGHHRSASSAKVAMKRREEHPDYDGTEEFNFFMSVLFADDELYVMDYNRVVHDLNGHSEEEFLKLVSENFTVKEVSETHHPSSKYEFGMYLNKKWYALNAKEGSYNASHPVESLDADILQKNILHPILDIENPRTSTRIDFVGGIRGLKELEERVDRGHAVAFSMYPVTITDLISVADANMVMPPKSTWFEPKLRSGLFTHKLSD